MLFRTFHNSFDAVGLLLVRHLVYCRWRYGRKYQQVREIEELLWRRCVLFVATAAYSRFLPFLSSFFLFRGGTCPLHVPVPRSATDSCRVVFKIFCSALKTFICGPSYGTDNAMLANIGPSVVHPVVISRKLSKIDPWLLWNTVRKLSPLIQLSHSNSSSDAPMRGYSGFKEKYMFNINTACCSTWRQTTAVVNQARPSSNRGCSQLL